MGKSENEYERKTEQSPGQRQIGPVFPAGTVIATPSLVTDTDGAAWWVDPRVRTFERV